MRSVVISARTRPHLVSGPCWCRPRVETCECCDEEMHMHRLVDLEPADQPYMACFSEQLGTLRPPV